MNKKINCRRNIVMWKNIYFCGMLIWGSLSLVGASLGEAKKAEYTALAELTKGQSQDTPSGTPTFKSVSVGEMGFADKPNLTSDGEKDLQVFNKKPIASIKLKDIKSILNNPHFLGLMGLDNVKANFLLLAMWPQWGKDGSALKEGSNATVLIFEDHRDYFPYCIFQMDEKAPKESLKIDNFHWTEHEGYIVMANDKAKIDLLNKDKDFLKTLVDQAKEPITAGSIEFNLTPKFFDSLSKPLLSGLQVTQLQQHCAYCAIQGWKIVIRPNGNGLKPSPNGVQAAVTQPTAAAQPQLNNTASTKLDVYISFIFDATSPFYADLKAENYQEPASISEYIEMKDVGGVMVVNRIDILLCDILKSMIPALAKRSDNDNKNLTPIIDKVLANTREHLSIVNMGAFTTYQNKVVSFSSHVLGTKTLEKYLEDCKLVTQTCNDLSAALKVEGFHTLESNYQLSCEYQGHKIYILSINLKTSSVTPGTGGATGQSAVPANGAMPAASNTEANLGAKGINNVTTPASNTAVSLLPALSGAKGQILEEYVTAINGQFLGSDSLDYLKYLIDNVIAKKIPIVNAKSYLEGLPQGVILKGKWNFSDAIPQILSEMPLDSATSEETKVIKQAVENFLPQMKNADPVLCVVSAQNDRLQVDVSVDYVLANVFLFTLQSLGTALEKEFISRTSRPQSSNKVYKNTLSTKPGETKPLPLVPIKTSFIINNNAIYNEVERQVLIPVKILTENKAFG
ncbi:MAG: hypothetical protein LBB11_03190 [Puniceicoccales bacterium]|nr:hypothetical protein [Puniceicoccales bacterium]